MSAFLREVVAITVGVFFAQYLWLWYQVLFLGRF